MSAPTQALSQSQIIKIGREPEWIILMFKSPEIPRSSPQAKRRGTPKLAPDHTPRTSMIGREPGWHIKSTPWCFALFERRILLSKIIVSSWGPTDQNDASALSHLRRREKAVTVCRQTTMSFDKEGTDTYATPKQIWACRETVKRVWIAGLLFWPAFGQFHVEEGTLTYASGLDCRPEKSGKSR